MYIMPTDIVIWQVYNFYIVESKNFGKVVGVRGREGGMISNLNALII